MKTINHTNIPTSYIFGRRGYAWNPIKGCKNTECFLHPRNTGECWAAKACHLHAKPWAKHEAAWLTENKKPVIITQYENSKGEIELIYPGQVELENFIPYWFESQFQKKFPSQQSCIFVFSQTDLAFIPREWLQKTIDRIVQDNEAREMAGLPLHTFQFLTKNPDCYHNFKFPINCWLGFTATNQDEYDIRVLDIGDPFGTHWNGLNKQYAYLEPLRGPINIKKDYTIPSWVIVGGGPDSVHPDWVRSIRDQCQEAEIPFYFKSWGKWLSYWCPNDHVYKYTKAPKGNLYNVVFGEIWEQFPEVK